MKPKLSLDSLANKFFIFLYEKNKLRRQKAQVLPKEESQFK